MGKKSGVKKSGEKIVEKKVRLKKKMGVYKKKISSKSWKKKNIIIIIIVSVTLKSNCLKTKYLELFKGKKKPSKKVEKKVGLNKKKGVK